ARLHADEVPAPFQARAFERKLKVALVEPEMRIAFRHPAAAVPHDHGATAVLAPRDVALELEVLHRVVFGLHREPFLVSDEARPVRDDPALEHAIELEPQVIVQAPRRVHLHNELAAQIGPRLRGRLAGLAEITLALIFAQRGFRW